MRKRISRHIERCEVCGERKRRELTPASLAGAMPLAALFPGSASTCWGCWPIARLQAWRIG